MFGRGIIHGMVCSSFLCRIFPCRSFRCLRTRLQLNPCFGCGLPRWASCASSRLFLCLQSYGLLCTFFFVIGRIRLDWVGLGWFKAGLRLDWTRVEAGSPEGQPGPAQHASDCIADGQSAQRRPIRRCETRLALNFFNVHAAILPETVGNQKPTVGF